MAIDGKAWRGAHDRATRAAPLPRVSAFASDTRLTWGHVAVEAQSNDIPAGRALLSRRALEGGTVTLDALPAQRATAPALLEPGASYVRALKGQPGTLEEDVGTLLADSGWPVQERAQTVEADHGRSETREAHLVTERAWLQEPQDWPGLACVGKLTATREDKATGSVQTQARY